MPVNDFLVLWLVSFGAIFACRVLPLLMLRGRALSVRVTTALGYIPPAAFAALVANDLIAPGSVAANGLWATLAPWVASAFVALVACKTRSMLACCIAGVVAYVLLMALG